MLSKNAFSKEHGAKEIEGTKDSQLPKILPNSQSNQGSNLSLSGTSLAVSWPKLMASSQTSHSIINAKCETVEQNENEGDTEYKDKKKIQRNDTESEIERLRKILEEQKHPRRLKKSLGKENSPQRQKQLSQTQDYKPNEQGVGSNSEDERISKQEGLQIPAESSTEHGRVVIGKKVSEQKETLNEQEENIRINGRETNDQVEKITKKKIKTQNKKETTGLQSEKVRLEQDTRHITNKRKTDNKNVIKTQYQNPEGNTDVRIKRQSVQDDDLQTSFIFITNDMDFTFLFAMSQERKIQDIEEQVEWSADKIYPHNTEIRTPDGCGPAICGTYQQQISTELSYSDIDECEFTNDLKKVEENNNMKSERSCNVDENKLISRSSCNETEILNTGNDMTVKGIPRETLSEFTKGKRNGAHAVKPGHTYVNEKVYNSENHVYDDDTENTISVITVDDSFNVYGQLFTRVRLKSVLNDSVENNQVHINTEHQSLDSQGRQLKYPGDSKSIEPKHKSADVEKQIPDLVDEHSSSNSLYYSRHTQFNGSNLSKNTGELDQSDTVYEPNAIYNSRRVDSSSRRRDIQSQSSSSYHPWDGYKDNICQSSSSIQPDDRYQDNICQSNSSYHPGHAYKDNICQSSSSYHPWHKHKDNICQSQSSDSHHLKSVENQSNLATSVQQQQTCTLQEQVDVDSPLEDCSEGDLVLNLNTLTKHFGFIVKDVIPDGNCMFSAIIDQLRISGNLDFTPQTLRKAAVSQLRNNPINKDGTHMESFLDTESWETYLTRMAQEYVWGDHLALQACTEVTGYRIHVIKCPFLITKLEPAGTEPEQYSILYLGHVSESHFISLRQRDWEETWHIKAKVRNLQKHFPRIFTSLVNQEFTIKRKKFIRLLEDIKLLKTTTRKLECELDVEQQKKHAADKSHEMDPVDAASVKVGVDKVTSQSPDNSETKEIQLPTDDEWEELENWLSFNKDYGLPEDKFGIDDKSGVSLLHLTSLVKYSATERDMIRLYIPKHLEFNSKHMKYIGSIPEDLRYSFIHYHTVSEKDCNCVEDNRHLKSVVIDSNSRVLTKKADDKRLCDLISDTELCNPGYTLLCPCDLNTWKRQLHFINGQKPVVQSTDRIFDGWILAFVCEAWPESTLEWTSRDRPSGWPKKEHIEAMKISECLVVPRPHPKGVLPECEWQFIFPDAEQILAKDCLSEKQKYCFKVFKVLVDFHLQNGLVRLTTTHLKTIMYFACEVIPQSCWSENIGGCILYLLERLGIYLTERNLPNYFIKENNMIEHFNEEQISWAIEKLLTLRLFPMLSIIHFADHHGIDAQMASSILADRSI